MGTTLGLPRHSSIFGLTERAGSRASSLLGKLRRTDHKYLGQAAGISPHAQERFLEARFARRQRILDALSGSADIDRQQRDQAIALVPRIGTLAIVSARNNMYGRRELREWSEGVLEGLDRTGIHRGMASLALQPVFHTEGTYEESFSRYASLLAEKGSRKGFVIDTPLEQKVVPVRHIESEDTRYLPDWLSSSLTAVDSPPNQANPLDQGIIILTDEISFTHAVRANIQCTEYARAFKLDVYEAVGVLSLHDMYENGATRLSRGSYPY